MMLKRQWEDKKEPLFFVFFRESVYFMPIEHYNSKQIVTMRDSFFHLKEWYMTTERPEDFELVRDYVVEQTRKVSLEQIGVDLTKQDTGDFQQGFTIVKRRVGQDVRLCFVWWDFSECEKHVDYRVLQNDIAKHFWPDIQFLSSASASLFTGGTRKNWRLR